MPVREAFRLLADGHASNATPPSFPGGHGAPAAAPPLSSSCSDAGGLNDTLTAPGDDRLAIGAPSLSRSSTEHSGPLPSAPVTEEQLRTGLQSLTELSKMISATNEGLERMSRVQRNSIVEELSQGLHSQQLGGAAAVPGGVHLPAHVNV